VYKLYIHFLICMGWLCGLPVFCADSSELAALAYHMAPAQGDMNSQLPVGQRQGCDVCWVCGTCGACWYQLNVHCACWMDCSGRGGSGSDLRVCHEMYVKMLEEKNAAIKKNSAQCICCPEGCEKISKCVCCAAWWLISAPLCCVVCPACWICVGAKRCGETEHDIQGGLM